MGRRSAGGERKGEKAVEFLLNFINSTNLKLFVFRVDKDRF